MDRLDDDGFNSDDDDRELLGAMGGLIDGDDDHELLGVMDRLDDDGFDSDDDDRELLEAMDGLIDGDDGKGVVGGDSDRWDRDVNLCVSEGRVLDGHVDRG